MNKKILLLVPRLNIGGAETYVTELAISLKKDGYEVFVASGGGVLVKKIKSYGIKHFFVSWYHSMISLLLSNLMSQPVPCKYVPVQRD